MVVWVILPFSLHLLLGLSSQTNLVIASLAPGLAAGPAYRIRYQLLCLTQQVLHDMGPASVSSLGGLPLSSHKLPIAPQSTPSPFSSYLTLVNFHPTLIILLSSPLKTRFRSQPFRNLPSSLRPGPGVLGPQPCPSAGCPSSGSPGLLLSPCSSLSSNVVLSTSRAPSVFNRRVSQWGY